MPLCVDDVVEDGSANVWEIGEVYFFGRFCGAWTSHLMMCLVLRNFSDKDVVETGSGDPKKDLETLRMELVLADLSTLEKQNKPKGNIKKEEEIRWGAIEKLKKGLGDGKLAREVDLSWLYFTTFFICLAGPCVHNTDWRGGWCLAINTPNGWRRRSDSFPAKGRSADCH